MRSGVKVLDRGLRQAATPKSLSTNFACPTESPPSNLFTCSFLIFKCGRIPPLNSGPYRQTQRNAVNPVFSCIISL